MGVVAFDYDAWALRYPEFNATVTAPVANAYFQEAQLYCDNNDHSIICNLDERAVLLNMVTAHIAQINAGSNSQPASPLVGRINNASEGSVSVQAEYADVTSGLMAWFLQTKYGASFWTATAKYRMGRYFPGPERNMDPYYPVAGDYDS